MLGGLVSLLVVQLLVLPALLMTTAGQHPAGRGPRPSSREPAGDTSPVIAREAH